MGTELERPENPVIDELEDILDECDRLKRLREETLALIPETLAKLKPLKTENEEEFKRVVFWLYWNVEEIKHRAFLVALYNGAGSSPEFQKTIKGVTQISCKQCGRALLEEVRTRGGYKETRSNERRSDRGYLCQDCEAERRAKEAAQEQERADRIERLRTMPYKDYLQSPEWHTTRADHLRKAGFRCQLCNAKDVVLNVHHRTYERRGCERFVDLIVLCDNCHAKHHDKVAEGRS